MEGHWLEGLEKATEPLIDLGSGAEFHRRRKMEECGISNDGLRKQRLRAASLAKRIRLRRSDRRDEAKEVHDNQEREI